MNSLAQKLRPIEQQMSEEKGRFLLFALFLREDAPDLWDLLVSAPWVEANKADALRYIVAKLKGAGTPEELAKLSRVSIIEQANPALGAIQSAFHVEHGMAEIQDSNFFGLPIKHAYIVTSRRDGA